MGVIQHVYNMMTANPSSTFQFHPSLFCGGSKHLPQDVEDRVNLIQMQLNNFIPEELFGNSDSDAEPKVRALWRDIEVAVSVQINAYICLRECTHIHTYIYIYIHINCFYTTHTYTHIYMKLNDFIVQASEEPAAVPAEPAAPEEVDMAKVPGMMCWTFCS